MQREPVPCDRCGATILREGFERPLTIQFVDEDDGGASGSVPETEPRTLCATCCDDLRAWIDGDAPDRSAAVDTTGVERFADGLDRTADELADLAADLRALQRGGDDA